MSAVSTVHTMPTVAAFARAMHRFLDDLDPARTFGEDALDGARDALRSLHHVASDLQLAWDGVPPVSDAEQRLRTAVAKMHEALPALTSLPRAVPEWFDLRERLSPLYESMTAALAADGGAEIAPLRPTNHLRNMFHASMGLVSIAAFEHVITPSWAVGLAGVMLGWAWGMEGARRYSPKVNDLLMWAFGPVAHPHESVRINSATWYTTAVFIICVIAPNRAGVLGLLVLSVGDPMAAIIGRRFGRTKVVGNKSIEGTAGFVGVASVASVAYLLVYYPDLSPVQVLSMAAAAAVGGGLAELFTQRMDDNLTIPVLATLAVLAVGLAF